MISASYRDLNAQLHRDRPDYGTSGIKNLKPVLDLIGQMRRAHGEITVIDYGCGKQTLSRAVGVALNGTSPTVTWTDYDPCIPGLDRKPWPADLVICTDVLEHIEPEHLDAVLDDLKALMRRAGYFTIATGPAKKTLADGRNAHLIVQPPNWWLERLIPRFGIVNVNRLPGECVCVLESL